MSHNHRSWREAEFVNIREAADILCRSRGAIYVLLKSGPLRAVVVAGRTLVTVDSLTALVDGAEPFTPVPGHFPGAHWRQRRAAAAAAANVV